MPPITRKKPSKPSAVKNMSPKKSPKKSSSAKSSATSRSSIKSASARPASARPRAAGKSMNKISAAKQAKPSAASAPMKPAAAVGGLIPVGAKAPDFTLPDATGKLVTLSAFKGKPVVLYFYPKDDTPGCTQEACDFRDNLAAFRKLGCTVLGVSPDSVRSHAKFAAKHKLTITLLADEPAADGTPPACAQYGIWQEKSLA